MALLEDQIEEAQAAFLAAHEAKDTAGAQALADHLRGLQAQKAEVDQAATESSQEGTNLRNPLMAGGVGALVGAAANPLRGAVHDVITPPTPISKISVPAPPSFGGQGGENWTKSLTGVDVPNAQMNKGSLDTAQRMAATVAPGGELAGGKITPGGIMLGPEIGAKPPAPAPLIPRTTAQAKQTGKSLLQGIAGEPQPTSPFSIVKGGTRGAITGAALADVPQQLSQGNYGTAASDIGVATGNIAHGLARTPKGKALSILLGLGSGILRGQQGVSELMAPPPEQKANGGLMHLAGGGQPEFGEARAYEPSYSEKIRDYAAKHIGREHANRLFGGANARPEDNFNPYAMALQTPGVIADSAAGFLKAGQEGDYLGGMGHYLTGALNVAPMLKPAGKFVKKIVPGMAVGGDVLKVGAELAKKVVASKPQKFSEAIEPFIGTHSLHPTIVDKTKLDLAAGRMAGPEAPYLQEISQPHKESGWIFANDSLGAANKLYNMGKSGNTLVTGLLGSPTQLKTNRSVFGEIADEYYKAIKEGKMSPELQAKIQARLPTLRHGKENIQTFPQEFDIRDRDAFNEMATGFHQRGHLADIMGGKGVSQGLPRGTGKIIPYEDILMRNTEESLQGAPTHSVGSRLFTVGSKPPEYRPDLHNAFDYANFGELKSGNFGFAPKEIAYPDEIARIKANLAAKGIGRDITAMDLMRNTINQPITEQLWRRAQTEGYAPGGRVGAAKKLFDKAQAAYRAKFTPGFYHGSPANDIEAFDPTKSIKDPMYTTPQATFVTRDPQFAESFLSMNNSGKVKSGSTMYPVNVNLGQHWNPNTPEGKALISEFIEKYPKRVNLEKGLNRGDWTAIENSDFLRHLKDTGHDTFHVMEGGVPNVGVLKPENIRGKFAEFNPEHAADPDFMKAEGGAVQNFQAGGVAKLLKHAHGQNPKVAQALEEYLKGNISQEERIRIMNQFLPMRQWKDLPPNYTDDEIRNALMSNKQAKALAPVPAGMRVGNRLDIPAYTQNGVYVDTTHALTGGKSPISYNRTGHLKDVEFSSKPDKAVRVGLGTQPQALTPMAAEYGADKSPFALIQGTNVGTKDDEVRRMMQEMMQDPNYTQIGMDPRKHSQFYDKSTGMPVFAAEEKLQSGPLIIAPKRGLETTSWDDPRLNLSDFEGKKYAGGGKVGALEMLAKKLIPQAERQTNKSKFLEGNHPMVPEVVYHATRTAPKGDAIDQMIGSKYGTLGSGMYTTPDTQFGSTYTGIPTPETIEKLKTSFPAMARPFVKAMDEGDYSDVPMGGYMMPLHPSVKNPLILEGIHADPAFEALAKLGVPDSKIDSIVEKANEKYGSIGKEIQSRAQKLGHDGVILFKDGNLQEMVTYSPNQLKSAIGNEGTFNPYDPRLSKKRGGKVNK